MRGTLLFMLVRTSKRGIIPADAGNTGMDISSDVGTKDHPRGCGEHKPVHFEEGWE